MTISEMHRAFKRELDKTESLQYPAFTSSEIDYFLNRAIIKFIKTRYSGLNLKGDSFEETQKRIDDLRTVIREATVPCSNTAATKPNGYTLTTGFSNAVFSGAPYWLSLGEEVMINITASNTNKRQGVTEITANEYRFYIDNPFSEHVLHYNCAKPLRLFYNNTIEFISDSTYTITSAYIRYIKEPVPVNLTTVTGITSGNILPGRRYVVATSGTVTYNGASIAVGNTFVGVEGVTTFTPAGGATVNFVASDCELASHTHDEIVQIAAQMVLENIEQPRYQTYSNEVSTME